MRVIFVGLRMGHELWAIVIFKNPIVNFSPAELQVETGYSWYGSRQEVQLSCSVNIAVGYSCSAHFFDVTCIIRVHPLIFGVQTSRGWPAL